MEYETLSPNFEETEDENIDLVQDNSLKEIELAPGDRKLVRYLKEKGILTILDLKNGLSISSSSHIGVVQLTNFSISIMPKIFLKVQNLAKLIEYSYDLEDLIIPETETKFEQTENILIEIIVASFVKQCQKLLRQGLAKAYVTHQENTPYLRGKLILKQQFLNVAKKNMQFACEFDELEHDILENQIIQFTLDRCYHITNNESLRKEIRRLNHQISGFVDKTDIKFDDFERIHYTRLNQHYEKIHQLCKLIISASGISDFYQQKTPFVNSFFVDMNVIFEAFVAKLFKKYYPLDSEAQKNRKAWIIDNGSSARIRTDILIYHDSGKEKDVIDTKYKKRLNESDRFQIGFYIHEYERKEGYAILPTREESKNYKVISEHQGIAINVKHLNIDNMLELVFSENNNKSKIKDELIKIIPL